MEIKIIEPPYEIGAEVYEIVFIDDDWNYELVPTKFTVDIINLWGITIFSTPEDAEIVVNMIKTYKKYGKIIPISKISK